MQTDSDKAATPAPADKPLLEFPCDFPIKFMGLQSDDLIPAVVAAVQSVLPGFDAEQITARPSSGGKYMGLTLTVRVDSRAQLDAVYRALTSHPLAKYVL